MKTKAVWISCILAALFCGRSANAGVIMTLDQVGNNVVAMASGMLDLTDLGPPALSGQSASIDPSRAILRLGEGQFFVDVYFGVSGPGSFGSGGFTEASTSTGSGLSLNPGAARGAFTLIGVPEGYVSGMPLDGSATWDNTTLAALGVTPETTFTWTWGSGAHADSLTLKIAIPEPASAMLLTLGVAGLVLLRWRTK